MIDRLRAMFSPTEKRADNYTETFLAGQLATARGFDGIRGSAAYKSALNLIAASASVSDVSGDHAEALRPHIGSIARALTDRGESTFSIEASATGQLVLIPITISDVVGSADPTSWHYSATRTGPSENRVVSLPAEAVVAFKINASPRRAWRGRGALEASATADLLAGLEKQLSAESRFSPARLVSGTMVKDQRHQIKDTIAAGGIVTIAGGKSGGTESTKALEVGALGGEFTAAGVKLHEQLSSLISSVLGVPADLLSAGSEAGSRESFRRFAATTMAATLEAISIEFNRKIGPLEISMDRLRAGDISARSRAVGTRAAAVGRLVTAGVDLERAMRVAGLDG